MQHMANEAALHRDRLQRGAESKKLRSLGASDSCTGVTETPASAPLIGKVTGRDTGDGHALGERFSWQAGMLSFGSLLGAGTYASETGNNTGKISRDSES